MPHAALWVVQPERACRSDVVAPGVSMPHAALWVVQHGRIQRRREEKESSMPHAALWVVQHCRIQTRRDQKVVSMPHAALWVVQPEARLIPLMAATMFQCRTRLCGWCSFVARSPCPPKGKKPFWKVSTVLCGFAAHPHDVPFRSLHRLYHSRDYAK